MSRSLIASVLVLLFAAASATASAGAASEGFLSAHRGQRRAGRAEAARWADEDDQGEELVGAFTPVSEAEEMEANGDSVDDDSSDDSSPDDDEPEDVEDNTVPSGFEEVAYDSGAD